MATQQDRNVSSDWRLSSGPTGPATPYIHPPPMCPGLVESASLTMLVTHSTETDSPEQAAAPPSLCPKHSPFCNVWFFSPGHSTHSLSHPKLVPFIFCSPNVQNLMMTFLLTTPVIKFHKGSKKPHLKIMILFFFYRDGSGLKLSGKDGPKWDHKKFPFAFLYSVYFSIPLPRKVAFLFISLCFCIVGYAQLWDQDGFSLLDKNNFNGLDVVFYMFTQTAMTLLFSQSLWWGYT